MSRVPKISEQEQRDAIAFAAEDAVRGLLITASDFQRRIQKKTSRKVSDDYVYDLFNRHGWRKIVPRRRHPKSRKEQQEAFI